MTALGDIPVTVDAGTGNVLPLLHEIRHALDRLAIGGEGTVIDLRSLPLAPGEESRIEKALGQGEVAAHITALGESTVRETSYPGVWIVTHRNTADEVIARFIEVCRIPEILAAQSEDLRAGVQRLSRALGAEGEEVT